MIALLGRLPLCVRSGMTATTCVVALCASAQARVAPPFATLIAQTQDAPRLAVSDADIRRAEGVSEQARTRPNPSLNVMSENVSGSSPYRGFDRAETTVQYSQPIELGGKRTARIAAGEAGVAAAKAWDRDARIAYAHDLARAYVAVEIAERRITLAEDEREAARSDLRAARALVQAGKEAHLRALQAETALNEVDAQWAVATADHIAALARLSALAGVEEVFSGLSESLLDGPATTAAYGPVDPLATAPYLAAAAEREAAERRMAVERKRAIPDITATVGVRRLSYENATALLGGVTIPLNLFDRNKGNIAASRAEVAAAEARLAMARNDARASAQAASAQLSAADARLSAAKAAQAVAEESYRLSRIAYEAGKSPLVELLNARHGLGVARGVALDAAAARFDARAQLSRLQGRTISGDIIQ